MLYILFAALLLTLVAIYFYLKKDATASTTSDASEEKASHDPMALLVGLNLTVRRAELSPALLCRVEEVVDMLVDLLPRVSEEAGATGELAWSVNRIATEYLPNKCIFPYLSLAENGLVSEENTSSFTDSLTALLSELNSVSDTLHLKDLGEFDRKAAFLKARFTNTGD